MQELEIVGSPDRLELRKRRGGLLSWLPSATVVFDRGRGEVRSGSRSICSFYSVVAVGVSQIPSPDEENFIYLVYVDSGEHTHTLHGGGSWERYRMIQDTLCAYVGAEKR